MIIGFEAKRVFENHSGLGNYSRNTINSLVRQYPGNRYLLFVPRQTTLYKCPDQVEVILPLTRMGKKFRSWWRLHWVTGILRKVMPDLYHGLSHLLPVGIEKTGIPSVVTIHDLIFLRYPEFYSKIDRYLYKSTFKNSCKRATRIIAISRQTRDDLVQFFGIPAEKIEVIYQSCDARFYQPVGEDKKAAIRQKFSLPDTFILTVGTIERRKNQLNILKGMVDAGIDTPLVILGKSTNYQDQLNRFIRENGMEQQVLFLHNSSMEELQAIYQMAAVMVYPSFFEGFGLPVLEAQASGCPVVTSNISSLPEAGGNGAIYISPEKYDETGKAIQSLLSDTVLRDEMISKGSANAALFKDEIVAQRLMEFYRQVVKASER